MRRMVGKRHWDMIVIQATVRVLPDKAEEYERLYRDLAPRIRATQPGIVFYEMAKNPNAPLVYKAMEVYRDEAAMKSHVGSDLLREAMPAVRACLDGDPLIEVLRTVDY